MIEEKKLRIAVIIPTYNRKNFLKIVLDSLFNQTKGNYEIIIIVVIDGSTDGTLEMIIDEYPNVKIVIGNGTWYYTKSINKGFSCSRKFKPDYVLTLNDDVEFRNDYLISLMKGLKEVEKKSIIGSISFTQNRPYRITFSGIKEIKNFPNRYIKYHKPLRIIEPQMLTGIHPSCILTGRGMLIPFMVLRELNYFDSHFIQYHSDSDFCLRAIKNGYKIYINWDAKIYSHLEKTSSSTSFIKIPFFSFINNFFNKYSRNYLPSKMRFLWRHQSPLISFPNLIIFIILSFKNYFFKPKISVYNFE